MVRLDQLGAQPELAGDRDVTDVKVYLEALMADLRSAGSFDTERVEPASIPGRVFDVLTNREFCYLSKARASAYRDGILAQIAADVAQERPLEFFYDIGGGYHATTQPGKEDVSFDVGLAEVFVLGQISSFIGKVARFYRPGARFSLVIDNMCALLINDIPLVKTLEYCAKLRQLIRQVGMVSQVDLLVESEVVTLTDFAGQRATDVERRSPAIVSRKEHDNVERFLGRVCDDDEAADRASRYKPVTEASERLLAPFIRGVHMTQRSSETTICFRPFPGGDSRIQCGQVALTRNSKQKLHPVLLTSGNRGDYVCRQHQLDLLGSAIPYVMYAERISSATGQ